MDLDELDWIIDQAEAEEGPLDEMVSISDARALKDALREAMRAFGSNPQLRKIGIEIGGTVRELPREALYRYADQLKGLGSSDGSWLGGRPKYPTTQFGCPFCKRTCMIVGHRKDDPPPVCPEHDCEMVAR